MATRFIGFVCRMFRTAALNGRPVALVPIDAGWTPGHIACLLSQLWRELSNLCLSQGWHRNAMQTVGLQGGLLLSARLMDAVHSVHWQ